MQFNFENKNDHNLALNKTIILNQKEYSIKDAYEPIRRNSEVTLKAVFRIYRLPIDTQNEAIVDYIKQNISSSREVSVTKEKYKIEKMKPFVHGCFLRQIQFQIRRLS